MNTDDFFKKLSAGAKFKTEKNKLSIKRKIESESISETSNDQKAIKLDAIYDDENEQSTEKLNKKLMKKQRRKTSQNLANLKQEKVNQFCKRNKIFVWGSDIPNPIENFKDLTSEHNLKCHIVDNALKMGFTVPTPIQMQAIPILLNERELLACAPTGSGKTVAFLIPVIHHLKEHRKSGTRAVIVAPTRELAKQIQREADRLAEGTGITSHVISKANLTKLSSKKHDILVTTPNRLVFLLNQTPSAISLSSVQWLIIDESDKLFEAGKQGFRDQLAVIYKACDSPNIRRAMFSATYAYEVEQWCKLNMDNIVTVSVGVRNSAAEIVKQNIVFVGSESGKLVAFRDLVKKGFVPPVLVFVQTKERAKELFNELIYDGINVDVIHADRTQTQRDNVVKCFRTGKIWVLICTELMGRGIDFKGVNVVVNYDFPPSAISYIHRIGRTGRAGRPGEAITFFTENDVVNLRSIAQIMKNSGCEVPDFMLNLKKATKNEKKDLAKRAPKRAGISTIPKYDIQKKKRKLEMIAKSKKIKSERKPNQRE